MPTIPLFAGRNEAPLECGGLTPLWSFLSLPHALRKKKEKKERKKESGVKPPHSKGCQDRQVYQ
jgi:hypothetical protein